MVLALLSGAHRPTAFRAAAACPQALGPHQYGHVTRARAGLLPPAVASPPSGYPISSASSPWAPRSGSHPHPRRVRSVAARGGSPRFRFVSVSALPLAVAAWGVVRPGGRRWRACRCSRGRRPIGSDTEATDPLEPLPQRHRSGVGGRLTRTRLRHACRLQRPCSLPRCSC